MKNETQNTDQNILGGDEIHAYTFGRLDAALGDNPTRFSIGDATHLRGDYLRGYESMKIKLSKPAETKPEFSHERC